jgi:acetyl esterase/lipase
MRFWLGTLFGLFAAALSIGMLLNVLCGRCSADYIADRYSVVPNLTYLTANGWNGKLDVYLPRRLAGPNPTLIYIHGGGWIEGSKEDSVLFLLPYLEMGWTVINVDYRLGHIALAPAAVEDSQCALRWVIANAKKYNLDSSRLVVTGHSAGGHLALATTMVPISADLYGQCPYTEELKVAAIINWYGITDVGDLINGPNTKDYAVAWLGNPTNRIEIAKRVSPLNYVRPGLPPILTIHGDADTYVPYSQAVKLHEALDKVGVSHQLLTIPGGKHGGFSRAQTLQIYSTIREFLTQYNLMSQPSSATSLETRWLSWICRDVILPIRQATTTGGRGVFGDP